VEAFCYKKKKAQKARLETQEIVMPLCRLVASMSSGAIGFVT
jgi:hypothetical protein